MKFISERLSEERERLGLKKGEVAKAGGIANSTYTNYEDGTRSLDGNFLAGIAKIGVDVLYILTGTRQHSLYQAERLTDLRHEALLTQEQAATHFKVPKADWIAYERGHAPIPDELLARLSAQGWDLAYLLAGIRQGMMAAGRPLAHWQTDLLGRLSAATDADIAALRHIADLIKAARQADNQQE